MPALYVGEVVARRTFGRCTELVVGAGPAFHAEPGQFVHVRCGGRGLVLRRPYSVAGVDGGRFSLLVREVGPGSEWLCAAEVGKRLDLMGPLGRGFDISGGGMHVLLAGGTGIAPLRFLASRLRERGARAAVFWGTGSEEEYRGLADALEGEMDLRVATMDGSRGRAGSVLDLFRESELTGAANIYACGPRGMMKALAECITGDALADLQVCMEERMACGVGACRGCVVPAAGPDGGYLTACKDGPVFRGRELDWRKMRG